MDIQKQREVLAILQKLKQEKEYFANQNNILKQENEKLIYQNKLLINKVKSMQDNQNKMTGYDFDKQIENSYGLAANQAIAPNSLDKNLNDKNIDTKKNKKKSAFDGVDMILVIIILLLIILQVYIVFK